MYINLKLNNKIFIDTNRIEENEKAKKSQINEEVKVSQNNEEIKESQNNEEQK